MVALPSKPPCFLSGELPHPIRHRPLSSLFWLCLGILLTLAPADSSQSSSIGTMLCQDACGRDGIPEQDAGNEDRPHSASSCGDKSRREARTRGANINSAPPGSQRNLQRERKKGPPHRKGTTSHQVRQGLVWDMLTWRREGSSSRHLPQPAGSCDSTWGN